MDANQTRFHLLLGEKDWLRCVPTPTDRPLLRDTDDIGAESLAFWDKDRAELTLRPKVFRFVTTQGDRVPELGSPDNDVGSDRRGAARDRFGNWFWISADCREIRVFSAGCKQTSHFWGLEDWIPVETTRHGLFTADEAPAVITPPASLSALAITSDHYLVAGTLQPGGLFVFDLHVGGAPRQLCWPAAVPFAPFDLASRVDGGVWILDRHNRRYWALDRHLRVITRGQTQRVLQGHQEDLFQPAHAAIANCDTPISFPEGISLESASPIDALAPSSIEALPNDQVLVLDAGVMGQPSALVRYYFGQRLSDPIFGAPPDEAALDKVFPDAYDIAFVPQPTAADPDILGDLYVLAREGNQSFRFSAKRSGDQLWLAPAIDYFPLRLFTGMGLVAAGSQVFYDSNGRWVPLVRQDRPQYLQHATVISPIFDGRDPACVWHRLLIDAYLPAGTAVKVWSRAAEHKAEFRTDALSWQLEPEPYRRRAGSELPFAPPPSSQDAGTFELLFQKSRGRFLQIKFELSGNSRSTPRLRAVRIWYPRFSYLARYLPAVYRADSDSSSFLDRFLANLEGTNTALEDKIAAVQILFDLRSAPAEALDWLGAWFGIALDPAWDEARQRLLLNHALHFFQWRGTVHGLQMALHLAFDETVKPSIFRAPGTRSAQAISSSQPSSCTDCAQRGPDPFRIVEKFLMRRAPSVAFGEPDANPGPKRIEQGGRWDPNKGVAELRRRFREFTGRNEYAEFDVGPASSAPESAARTAFALRELGFESSDVQEEPLRWRDFLHRRYSTISALNSAHQTNWVTFESITVPADTPANAPALADWRAHLSETVGEPYGAKRVLWQDFLARRYTSIGQLNAAYGTHWPDFDVVGYPTALPAQSASLWDWFKFESLVLPTLAAAHQFSVLLPFTGQTRPIVEERLQQLELARRIVELEKPAHTTFQVKFYWALFRLGEARLGVDTTLGLGGRDPALLPASLLGQTYLAETQLSTGHPLDVTDRQIIGRDRLT